MGCSDRQTDIQTVRGILVVPCYQKDTLAFNHVRLDGKILTATTPPPFPLVHLLQTWQTSDVDLSMVFHLEHKTWQNS